MEEGVSRCIHTLVLPAADRATIAEAVASGENDYPHSEKLKEMREHLHGTKALPRPRSR